MYTRSFANLSIRIHTVSDSESTLNFKYQIAALSRGCHRRACWLAANTSGLSTGSFQQSQVSHAGGLTANIIKVQSQSVGYY